MEIRWNGRGGQGAFTASKLLGGAAVADGLYGLAFPSFGPERRGAPMEAYTKISENPIRDRSEVKKYDYIIYLDASLYDERAKEDLKENGRILLNSEEPIEDSKTLAIPATRLAMQWLGKPVVNTIMLAALIHFFSVVSVSSYLNTMPQFLGEKIGERNQIAIGKILAQWEQEEGGVE